MRPGLDARSDWRHNILTIQRIQPHELWIGHADDPLLARALFDHDIRAVVQLAAEEPPAQPPREMIMLRFPLVDGSGNDPAMLRLAVDSVARLVEQQIPTLVCCGAGMNRSPAVIAAALSRVQQRGLEECLEHVAQFHATDMSSSLWE